MHAARGGRARVSHPIAVDMRDCQVSPDIVQINVALKKLSQTRYTSEGVFGQNLSGMVELRTTA